MTVEAYIQSGVLEEYCLGLLNEQDEAYLLQMAMLYPEVKSELSTVEIAMECLAQFMAIAPRRGLKKQVLAVVRGFADAEAELDINHMPATDQYSSHQAWWNTLAHLVPDELAEDFSAHLIRRDDRYQQTLIITKNDVPEEEHGEFIESFFILKGQCECTVENELHCLSPGDFLEIPLHAKHDIKIVSPHVVGILQYRFV